MNKIIKKEINFCGKKLVLETGELAPMANMSVRASYGDTVILVTAVSGEANPDIDFFPLTVGYEERLYSSGSIKSSRFVKRDGRPTDDAIITKRLIDHAIRPLFPQDYMDEVQVIATVLSLDEESDPEVTAMIGASACLMASNIPWSGPMSTMRVGYVNGEYMVNPGKEVLHEKSELDMMISFAGKDKKFLAVETEAKVLPEEKILGGIEFAFSNLDDVVKLISEFAEEVNPGLQKYAYTSKALNAELVKDIEDFAKPKVVEMMGLGFDKTKLSDATHLLFEELLKKFEGKYKKADMARAFSDVEKHALQHLILEEGKRPDGRGIKDVRPISTSVSVLPRTHGSALFSRGITQVLTVTTLGSPAMELFIQNMYGEKTKRYIHYYNFPPYASGETGRMGTPGGREIGHGMLAEKALRPVIPTQKEFPYMIILVSETLSSSGSSSMAATCASSMALMDAGVPIKDMVAGVGVGLIVNDDLSKQLIMTDLAYMEDAYGFLDFKMTGTRTGVTAMQADMKMQGIPMNLLPKIMEQSKEGRMHVLDEMEKTIKAPKTEVSQYAPKMAVVQIDPTKIGMVIGSGGRTIKEIQERNNVVVSIDEDGLVVVTAEAEEDAQRAATYIEGLVREVKVGEIFDGRVIEIVDFGAFVEVLPGKEGLLHVSEIAYGFVKNVRDYLKEGDSVKVKVLAVNEGKISLSKKALEPAPEGMDIRDDFRRDDHRRHSDGGTGGNGGNGRFHGKPRRGLD